MRLICSACRYPVIALMLLCWLLDLVAEALVWLRDAIGYALQAVVAGLAAVDDVLRRHAGERDSGRPILRRERAP